MKFILCPSYYAMWGVENGERLSPCTEVPFSLMEDTEPNVILRKLQVGTQGGELNNECKSVVGFWDELVERRKL